MMKGRNTHDNRRPSLQFSSMTQAARLLIFAALINPTSAVVSQPNSVATTIAEGPRTVQIYWTPGATGGTPTGYFYEMIRCTNIAGVGDARCSTGYSLVTRVDTVGGATYIAASSCTASCSAGTCCSHTFNLERGWIGRIRVYAYDADGIGADDAQFIVTMPKTAPDKVDTLAMEQVANDGRHRKFTWSVPRDNGYAIESYVLRRTSVTTPSEPVHDYIFNCTTTYSSEDYVGMSAGQSAGTAAVDCTSYTSSCYPQGFRCAGSYSDAAGVMVPTWTGGAVSVTVGSDVDANDGSYINPTHTYTWSVLTFNAYNERCLMDNTCDNALYNVGWAATQQATQPSATPDQATFPGVGPKNQTTMQLRWTAPNPNGSPILEYRIVCTDVSNYVRASAAPAASNLAV